jgi:hypothetical protein
VGAQATPPIRVWLLNNNNIPRCAPRQVQRDKASLVVISFQKSAKVKVEDREPSALAEFIYSRLESLLDGACLRCYYLSIRSMLGYWPSFAASSSGHSTKDLLHDHSSFRTPPYEKGFRERSLFLARVGAV